MGKRIVVLGHRVHETPAIDLPKNPVVARNRLNLYNYVRVLTPENTLVDHISYLERLPMGQGKGELSVWDIYLSAGLILTSMLRRDGHQVTLLNAFSVTGEEAKLAALAATQPDIVAISTTFVLSQPQFIALGHTVRAAFPNALLVAGGQHVYPNLMYMSETERQQYAKDSQFDLLVNDSQGEATLSRLCKVEDGDFSAVPNLVWNRKESGVVETRREPEDNDLDAIDIDFSDVAPGSVVHLRSARSCTFKCAFCTYPSIAGDLALMSVDKVIANLKRAKAQGVGAIVFTDDTFNVPQDRFENLLDRMIAEDACIPWYSFLRCQFITEALVEKMHRSGCQGVFLGIESGSDRILKNMKKGAVSKFYRDGITWLKNNNIMTFGAFVIGFPGETAETVAETRDFIETAGLDYYFMQPFFYMHHAPIAKRAKEFGLTGNGLFWQHNTMTWGQAMEQINTIFLELKDPLFVNPDYNLWEIAYLRAKGFGIDEYRQYRTTINAMTADQMRVHNLAVSAVTGRDAVQA